MTAKRPIRAVYASVLPLLDADRPFAVRGVDVRDSARPVLIHMTYEEMVAARDDLTSLIDNPPTWTSH